MYYNTLLTYWFEISLVTHCGPINVKRQRVFGYFQFTTELFPNKRRTLDNQEGYIGVRINFPGPCSGVHAGATPELRSKNQICDSCRRNGRRRNERLPGDNNSTPSANSFGHDDLSSVNIDNADDSSPVSGPICEHSAVWWKTEVSGPVVVTICSILRTLQPIWDASDPENSA